MRTSIAILASLIIGLILWNIVLSKRVYTLGENQNTTLREVLSIENRQGKMLNIMDRMLSTVEKCIDRIEKVEKKAAVNADLRSPSAIQPQKGHNQI
jgi:hypothetical protein